MTLASPNVMSLLRKRYNMIALLLQTMPKAHHNYAKRIITDNSPQAIITDRMGMSKAHSHSIVPTGFGVKSYRTLLIPSTSAVIL